MLFGTIGKAIQVPDPSLVLYLPFDEKSGDKVKDFSIYGNNGTLEGLAGKPQWVQGRYGTALEFTVGGKNSWVEVPDSDSLDITDEITMMAWIIDKGQTTWGRIVDKNHPYILYLGADNTLGGYLNDNSIVDFHSAKVPVDEWVHVAVTYDGSELKQYVNAELGASTPVRGKINEGKKPLTIGDAMGDQWFHNRTFIGVIDEVKIYNRALSADEIEKAMELLELTVRPSGKLATSWGRIKRL